MEIVSFIWGILEPLIFCFVILIFFIDPIRRWNFFGYRPTAVMVLFDPKINKFLLAKVNHAWAFNQGAIYDNNIYSICRDILKRELGLPDTRFKVIYTKALGTIRIANQYLLNRARISTISLFRNLHGKGYLACFIRINLSEIEKDIKIGAGIQDFKIASYEEALLLIKQQSRITSEHTSKKQELLLAMIQEIREWAKSTKEWEEEFTEAKSKKSKRKPVKKRKG